MLTQLIFNLFKFNNRNTRKRCEICSMLSIKTAEQCYWLVLVFLLLTLNIFHTFSSISIVEVEQVNMSWVFETKIIIKRLAICKSRYNLCNKTPSLGYWLRVKKDSLEIHLKPKKNKIFTLSWEYYWEHYSQSFLT